MTRQNAIDQALHVGVAFALVALVHIGGVVAGALAGLAFGLIRETAEASGSRITWEKVRAHFLARTDPWIDISFWALGGALAGLIVG